MKFVLFSVLFAFATMSLADSIIFETDFEEIPAGWYNDRWTFGNPGAKAHHYSADEWWDCDMSSYITEPPVYYFVPDGADSVVIYIEHSLYTSVSEGTVKAQFIVASTTIGGGTIYSESVFWYDTFTDTQPIVYSIVDPPDGTYLGFHFHAEAGADVPNYATINWIIFHMDVTVYGSSLGLQFDTWGSIKRCLF